MSKEKVVSTLPRCTTQSWWKKLCNALASIVHRLFARRKKIKEDKAWRDIDNSGIWCKAPSIGWTRYKKKFGVEFDEDKLEDFSYYLSEARGLLPFLPDNPLKHSRALSRYLQDCVNRGEPATTKSYVDFFFLEEDGVYRWDCFVEETDYKAFIKAVNSLDILY